MKTIVITVSRVFMAGHSKQGQPTFFADRILAAKGLELIELHEEWGGEVPNPKRHTIRADKKGYWAKSIAMVANGEAELSVRQWTGRPYASKQKEILRLTKEDGVCCVPVYIEYPVVKFFPGDDEVNFATQVAANDGLTLDDFWSWFGKDKFEGVLIHFDSLRYVADNESEVF